MKEESPALAWKMLEGKDGICLCVTLNSSRAAVSPEDAWNLSDSKANHPAVERWLPRCPLAREAPSLAVTSCCQCPHVVLEPWGSR